MTRKEFQRMVDFAVGSIPKRFRESMQNIAVVVEDEPSAELLAEMEIEEGDSLYGLFQGTPLTERRWSDGSRMPDKISIYQRPIEEDAEDTEDMLVIVVETVIHEFGHYFGLSEAGDRGDRRRILELRRRRRRRRRRDDDDAADDEDEVSDDEARAAAERAGGEGAEAIRSALPRTRLGRQADTRHRAGGH